MKEIKPSYLGDGVYATFDGEYIWLLTSSHDQPSDRVALDISVYNALRAYGRRAGWEAPNAEEK